MIVTKTPLRISFFGGGSDIPDFYNKSPGMVVSTTIDKYIQIAVNRCKTKHIRVIYSELEVVDKLEDLKHDRVKNALRRFDINDNIEICSFSDVPTKGTGLGSSSTFTVGLVDSLYNLLYMPYNKRDLAETSCSIEIEDCKQPIGKQDQYAAAYGGFNVIRFDSSGVEVTSIDVSSNLLKELNDNLICFSTGINRFTSDVLGEQVEGLKNGKNHDNTKALVDMAETSLKYLKRGKLNDFGKLLHESWLMKKSLASGISNDHIDEMYELALSAGAFGGKVLGAGGGGYLMLYVPSKSRNKLMRAMSGYKPFYFKFTDEGSKAIKL